LFYIPLITAFAQKYSMTKYEIKVIKVSMEFKKYPGPFQFIENNDKCQINIDSSGFLLFNRSDILSEKFVIDTILKNKVETFIVKSDKSNLMSSLSMQNYYCNEYEFIFNNDGSGKCICIFPNKRKKIFEWSKS